MRKTVAQRFTMGAIFLVAALGLGGCLTASSEPASDTASSTLNVPPAVSAAVFVASSEANSASAPAVYRIGKTTLASAKTNTDDSLIGTSGIKRSYSYKDAVTDGALVSVSDTNTGDAIFNTTKFDTFIENPTSRGIWVFHYILYNDMLSIHEMELIQYTASGFTEIFYDLYSNAKSVMNFDHIVREDWPDAVRYGAAYKSGSNGESARIMSFCKVCVYS